MHEHEELLDEQLTLDNDPAFFGYYSHLECRTEAPRGDIKRKNAAFWQHFLLVDMYIHA